jgi:type IV pilus assembly protein PilE
LKRANLGFSLIELMIAVVIVAILASVAFPSYQRHMLRGTRAEAQAQMMEIAGRQGQYLIDNRAYAGSAAALGITIPSSVASNYTIAINAPDGNPPTFTVTATPTGNQTKDSCGTLTLTHTGAKTASGTGTCW